jgi:PAS domain S-box-containing protein
MVFCKDSEITMRIFRNIAVFFVALLLSQQLHAAETKETKRVLIVYSLDKYHPAHRLAEQGMNEVFQEDSPFEVKVYSEYLDVGRFQGAEPARAMADLLRRKYANVKIDAIITVYLSALDFLLREKPLLFPRVPIVAAEVTRTYAETLDRSPLRRRITATIMGDNASGIVAAALRFKPKTQRFALVGGSTQLDAYYEQLFRVALKREAGPFEVIDLTKLPMQEILSRVGALPRDTVVLYGSIIRDGSGQSFTPREALTLLSRASNAPVFGLYDSYLGYGIVGGHLISFERQGKIAATMVLQLMAGASPGDIPFAGEDAYVDLYDWRELKRWKIPETAIPKGSELRYYVPSFWQASHWLIVGTLGLVFIETVLILGLLMNIRQRKQAERSLRASEEQVQLTTDTAGAGLWSLDREGGLVWASDRVFERYGLSKGKPATLERMLQSVHTEDRNLVRSAIRRAWETGKDVNAEYRLTLPGGEPRWIAARCTVSSPGPNATQLLIGASIDITEYKRSEESLAETGERYRAMVESFDGYMYICTADYRIEFMNQRMIERTGRSAVGESCFRALHERDAVCEWCVNDRVFQGETVHWEVQSPKDQRWYYVVNTPIRHNDGTVSKQAMIQDITERKRAENEASQLRHELAHLNRVMTISELSSSLAHEINQPLGAILNNAAAAKMLQDRCPEGQEKLVGEILDDIISDTNRAGQIVRKIRGMIRKESAVLELLDLNSLIGEVVELFRTPLNREKIIVQKDLLPGLAMVRGDRIGLQQVVMNIIMNATDSMKGGAERVLTIRTAMRGLDTVVTSISDSGSGIDEKVKDRLFEPFFTTKKGGLGMGLRICRSILEDHGGGIRSENNPKGGATFTFTLKADNGGAV